MTTHTSATPAAPWPSTCWSGTCGGRAMTCSLCPTSPTSTTRSSTGPPRRAPTNRRWPLVSRLRSSARWTASTSPTRTCAPGPPSSWTAWSRWWPTWWNMGWPTPPIPASTSTWTVWTGTARWSDGRLATYATAPEPGSTWTTTRTTHSTSPSGRQPSPASPRGTRRGDRDDPAGTLSAWLCHSTCWATASTSTAGVTTWSSPTTRTSGPRPWDAAGPLLGTGSTTGWSRWMARRCPSRWTTSPHWPPCWTPGTPGCSAW